MSRLERWKRRRRALGRISGPIRWRLATGQRETSVRMLGRAPVLHIWGDVSVGHGLRFRAVTSAASITVAPGASLVIGDDVFINQGVSINAERRIEIGHRVLIGDDVVIYDTHFHQTVPGEVVEPAPIRIEDDVWLGNGAMILPGVSIGRGSVVAARAVVTRSVPEGAVVAGVPAKVVRTFDVPEGFRRH